MFYATATHNLSLVRVYLTKASYDTPGEPQVPKEVDAQAWMPAQ